MSPHVRHADDLSSHLFHDIELMDLARAFVEPEQAYIGCCHINGPEVADSVISGGFVA